ncbi:hypothetical protein DUNSADRAFT_13295 [Dunaliella salina]|uniref:Encoded protein n=1 Tax=Dunaliella salina TaxID=3046 RepID=A0ABQ7G9N7_DUNSA|nr:hypothetical protein DUNSADRAFT_13295 [Dunaliella salina]|eukprot:KAF5831321.1 hypothetical protein DUNSADRAFT_13295 [Dunaliella salina]
MHWMHLCSCGGSLQGTISTSAQTHEWKVSTELLHLSSLSLELFNSFRHSFFFHLSHPEVVCLSGCIQQTWVMMMSDSLICEGHRCMSCVSSCSVLRSN